MASRSDTRSVSMPEWEWRDARAGLLAAARLHIVAVLARVAARCRRWREERQTWAALRHLDDRQLGEFGIDHRPPDLSGRKFP